MKITYKEGTEGKEDKIILFDGHRISFQKLAEELLICISEWSHRRKKDNLAFAQFINDCMSDGKVSKELIDRFDPTQHDIELAELVIAVYQNEDRKYFENRGEHLRNFLNEVMVKGRLNSDVMKKYGLCYNEFI